MKLPLRPSRQENLRRTAAIPRSTSRTSLIYSHQKVIIPKRGNITEHTQKCKSKLVQFKTYHGIKEQVLKETSHATQEA